MNKELLRKQKVRKILKVVKRTRRRKKKKVKNRVKILKSQILIQKNHVLVIPIVNKRRSWNKNQKNSKINKKKIE